MKFVVLIACHSDSDSIYQTVDSLKSLTVPAECERAIVIENGVAKKLKSENWLSGPGLPVYHYFTNQTGKSNALNVAIKNYVPDDSYILFSDDDIRFSPDWLIKYAFSFTKHGRGYFYGASLGVDYETPIDPAILAVLPPSANGVSDTVFKDRPSRAFLGCNWGAHAEDIKMAGFFNPNFGPGSTTGATGQESEMQDRLRKLGLRPLLVESNTVWHKVPEEKSSLEWAKQRAIKTGKERFIRKNGRSRWFTMTTMRAISSGIMLFRGRKEDRYRFEISMTALKSFLSQFFS